MPTSKNATTTVALHKKFMGLDWSNPGVIAGFSVGGIILLIVVAVLIWYIAKKTCLKQKKIRSEETTPDHGPPVSSDKPDNYLISLLNSNPKVKSVSQYGQQSKQ